ncbi:membrane hypothetical protein [Burkholderia sp. IT-111MI5]
MNRTESIAATPGVSPMTRAAAVLRVTSGNFIEQFDFFLFGFYATSISKIFFPSTSEFASLMLTFAVFGAGFLMRPLGAVFLGAYIDKVGRRTGLIVTLSIMASGTILIACVPGYATIGLLAPALVLLGRLLQGFSAGAELGGVSVYLAEMATPDNKGFYTSWQSASQQVAIVVAAAIGYALNQWLSAQQINAWGWRVPFSSAARSCRSCSCCAVRCRRPQRSKRGGIIRRRARFLRCCSATGAPSSAACC